MHLHLLVMMMMRKLLPAANLFRVETARSWQTWMTALSTATSRSPLCTIIRVRSQSACLSCNCYDAAEFVMHPSIAIAISKIIKIGSQCTEARIEVLLFRKQRK